MIELCLDPIKLYWKHVAPKIRERAYSAKGNTISFTISEIEDVCNSPSIRSAVKTVMLEHLSECLRYKFHKRNRVVVFIFDVRCLRQKL